MNSTRSSKRRDLLKAGVGGLGAAGMGLLAMPLDSVRAADLPAGLRPLYSKSRQQQAARAAEAAATTSTPPDVHVRALRRLTFGYTPQDLTDLLALGANFDQRLQAWVDNQLGGYQPVYPPVNDPPLSAVLNQPEINFETLDDSLTTLWQERVVAAPDWPYYQYPLIETQYLTLIRAVHSKWQLAEVLADFWHNHFSVQGSKFEVSPVFVHYDRDVIRPNMLGNFRDMLEAVTKSTAMMYYLDNVSNSKYGPNENYAREIQELHTLGAVHSWGFTPQQDIPEATPLVGSSAVLPAGLKAGYSEQDVLQVTRCLTGWTISNPYNDGLNTGEFIYYGDWHDDSNKTVLGVAITPNGQDETSQVLDLLAVHPNTAKYVCTKLCRRLIGDDPPASIIDQAALVFNDQWDQPDQLSQVVRTIILSSEFKDAAYWGAKSKRPFELMAGAMRSCGGPTVQLLRPDPFGDYYANLLLGESHTFSQDLYWRSIDAGNMPFTWVTPDGFPDTQAAWLGSTPLVMGWRQVNNLFIGWFPDDPANPDSSDWHEYFPVDVVSVTQGALASNQRTARNIVDFWVNQFLGYDSSTPAQPQLDSAVRDQLIAFMQQDAPSADEVLDLDASGWNNTTWLAYVPQRVQTLVASIAMLPDNMLR